MVKNIAVLVSGGGTNLQALLDAERRGEMPHGRIKLAVSDRQRAFALERAGRAGVEAVCLNKKTLGQAGFEQALLRLLAERHIDLIVLAGFLTILSPAVVAQYPNRIVNVHPSLIPAFCGKGYYGLAVHEAALRRGVKVTGATVHLVTEGADEGPILAQKAVAVEESDSPETLQKRVMEQAEWIILPQAVEMLCKQN